MPCDPREPLPLSKNGLVQARRPLPTVAIVTLVCLVEKMARTRAHPRGKEGGKQVFHAVS